VEESEAEVLLGVKISKNLTWTKQVEELRLELSRRVGIIRGYLTKCHDIL
jgi:hypothetical protein